jgi:hypothetical protein
MRFAKNVMCVAVSFVSSHLEGARGVAVTIVAPCAQHRAVY